MSHTPPSTRRTARVPLILALAGAALAALSGAPALAQDATCPVPAPAVHDIMTQKVYTDTAGSVADASLAASNEEQRTGIDDYLETLAGISDRYVKTGDAGARSCLIHQLDSWANDGSLVGGHVTMHGMAVRMFAINAIAFNAIKAGAFKQPLSPATQKWFDTLGQEVLAYMKRRDDHFGDTSETNLYYWSASALAAVSAVTHNKAYWDRARGVYDDAMKAINDDGTLRLEIRRAQRATIYHAFAAQPLVAIAAVGHLWGEDLSGADNGRLKLLMGLVLKTVADPNTLKAQAKVQQMPLKTPPWLGLYDPCTKGGPSPDPRVIRLGGSISALEKAINDSAGSPVIECKVAR